MGEKEEWKTHDEILELSRPLLEYLRSTYSSHCEIVISHDGVKINQTMVSIPIRKMRE